MQEIHNLSQFINFNCDIHQQEKLSLVCSNQQCEHKGLICVQCEYQSHQDHKCKSLGYIVSEIWKDYHQSSNLISYTTKLDIQNIKIRDILQKIVIRKEKTLVEQAINRYFNKLNKNIQQERTKIKTILSGQISKRQLNSICVGYKFYEREQQCQKNLSNFQLYLKDTLTMLQEQSKNFEHSIKQKVQVQQILQIFLEETQRKVSYIFSDKFKHTCMEITDKIKVMQKNNYSTNFILLQPMISGKKKRCLSKKSVKIHLDRLTSWISLGIAYESLISKANFYFNTGSTGHGAYVLSNNGYTWHHTNSSLNSYYASWLFNQGDTVTVTVEPKKKVIIYQKEGQTPYELPFQPIQGQDLYFCVALSSHQQTVSIQP